MLRLRPSLRAGSARTITARHAAGSFAGQNHIMEDMAVPSQLAPLMDYIQELSSG